MARVQAEKPSSTPVVPGKWPQHRVWYREAVDTGKWISADYLRCTKITEGANGATTAEFRFAAGKVIYPGEPNYTTRPVIDLAGKIVRVDLLSTETPPSNKVGNGRKQPPAMTWYFKMQSHEQELGSKGASVQPVDQTLHAAGLEDELDLVQINGAFLQVNGKDSGQAVHSHLTFNKKVQWGFTQVGNRSESRVIAIPINGRERKAYAFLGTRDSTKTDDEQGIPWTFLDIIEYLFNFFVTKIDVQLPWTQTGQFAMDSVPLALSTIVATPLSVERMTVKKALDRMLCADRGMGWCFRYEQGGEPTDDPVKPHLHIFPILDEPLALSNGKIPANKDVASVDTTIDVDTTAQLGTDRSAQYSQVLVLGDYLLSCFTLSFADGNLAEGWTQGMEDTYRAKWASRDPKEKTADLDLDQYKDVFCQYVLPDSWNGKVFKGTAGPSSDFVYACPKLDTDGRVLNQPSTLNPWGKTFEHYIPLRRKDSAANWGDRHDFVEPQIFLRYVGSKTDAGKPIYRYAVCDKLPQGYTDMNASVLQTQLGVKLHPNPPHVMAGVNVDGTAQTFTGSKKKSEFDYEKVIITVAMRTDQRLFVSRALPGMTGRQLVVEIQGAELWLIAHNTVIEAASDLKRIQQDTQYTNTGAGHYIVRDDTKRLQDIAASLSAWYGKLRQSVTVSFKRIEVKYAIGSIMRSVIDASSMTPINLPVTQVVHNFETGTTTVATQYKDLQVE